MIKVHSFLRAGPVATLIALSSLVALSIAPAAAVSDTQVVHDVTQSFSADVSCGSPPGIITVTYSGVFHATVIDGGHVRLTANLHGTLVLDPDDPALPTFAGTFVTTFGLSDNTNSTVQHQAFSSRASAIDGSGATLDIQGVEHLSISASGEVNVNVACH